MSLHSILIDYVPLETGSIIVDALIFSINLIRTLCYDERLGVHIRLDRMIVHKLGKVDSFIRTFRGKFCTVLSEDYSGRLQLLLGILE